MADQQKKQKLSDAKKQKASLSKGGGKSKPQPAADREITMGRLGIRVGKIVKAEKHSKADALYVEEIDDRGGEKFAPLSVDWSNIYLLRKCRTVWFVFFAT